MTDEYVAVYFCANQNCNRQLLRRERMDSGGVCPHCGHVAEGTICETVKKSGRVIPRPWWKFWVPWQVEIQ